jgi:hypothetical protein
VRCRHPQDAAGETLDRAIATMLKFPIDFESSCDGFDRMRMEMLDPAIVL